MTLLALVAIIFFGFATYNLTCAFVAIPTKKTSRMMMLARKQQGVKAEKLLDVYITKIAGLIAPYLKLDKLKRNKLQRALDIAGLELTPEIYTARAWVTAGAVGLCSTQIQYHIYRRYFHEEVYQLHLQQSERPRASGPYGALQPARRFLHL